jgi:YidC/Oxa1 family membrane protein insertase
MFHTHFYEPVYNLIVLVLTFVPLHDIGAAIVIVTLIVKAILLPFNMSALRTQYMMKKIEPEMEKIKELQKKNPQEASKRMVEVYRKNKINPFSSLFAMILQIPIFIALYIVFSKGLFDDAKSIYSFVTFPEKLHTVAFGIFDVTHKNIVIALLAGVSSYFLAVRQTSTMGNSKENNKQGKDESFQAHFAKSMKIQLLYVLPIIITVSAAALPSALGLYWFVSNSASYGLDVYMKRKLAHLAPPEIRGEAYDVIKEVEEEVITIEKGIAGKK